MKIKLVPFIYLNHRRKLCMEKTLSNFSLIKRLIPLYKKYFKTFILDILCVAIHTTCDLIFPLLFKTLMDLIYNPKPNLTFRITTIGIIYVLIFILAVLSNYYTNYIGHVMGSKMETTMRNRLFSHCQKLSVSYYDNNKIGQIISRLTSDLFEIGEFAHHAPEDVLIVLIKAVLTFVILINFNAWLTILIYLVMPLMIIYISHYYKKMKIATQANKVQIGELNAKIEDSLLGIRLTKSFANESLEFKKFHLQNIKTLHTKIRFYKAYGAFRAVNRIFSNLIYLIIIVAAIFLLVNRKTTVQNVIAYTSYITGLILAISKLLSFSDTYQKGLTAVNRFCEIVDLPIREKVNAKKLDPNKVVGKIEFKNVDFSYDSKSKPILHNFTLKINPREKIAIVGASGSGKTTICSLLKNFYSVDKGEILIDGINVEQIDDQNLNEIVGLVQQNVYLFTGTIMDNIKFAKPNASFAEIVEATKKARIFDFINSLENKFETNIGERGTKLSGGQKQQICITRMFLKNPKILILDEATSSVDSENEKTIIAALNELSKNKTTITIAHKINTIKNSNIIYLLNHGEIIQKGTHNELMNAPNSQYRKFYENFII